METEDQSHLSGIGSCCVRTIVVWKLGLACVEEEVLDAQLRKNHSGMETILTRAEG